MDVAHMRSEAGEHVADHMVAQDQDPVRLDLRRQVAVADVPGKFGEFTCRMAGHLHQRFLCRDDLDQPAILKFEDVAMFELNGFGKVDHHDVLMHQFQAPAPQMAFLMVEHDKVERHTRPAPVPEVPARLQHPYRVSTFSGWMISMRRSVK
jgi:hypothetical protein